MAKDPIKIPVGNFSAVEIICKLNDVVAGKNVAAIFYNKTSLLKGEIEVYVSEPKIVKVPVPIKQAKGHGSSPYRGVFWVKSENKWRAQFSVHGKRHTLGRFTDEIEAAKAYDKKAFEVLGTSAYLNFPEEVQHGVSIAK
ncbi:MAG: AP2 domain-containing protein [Solibacillus sp.]